MSEWPHDRRGLADILRRVVQRTRGRSDAEDLLQSAFVRFQEYKTRNEVTHATGFLVQTAANLAIDTYRRSQIVDDHAIDVTEVELCDDAPLQDEVLAARARLKRVSEGLEKLPERARKILLMHRLDGLTYAAIAARLGVSPSTVEKDIAKAADFLIEWTEGW